MNLGDRLKQLRTDNNWTQPQAAEAIGIEQSYLSKLENEKSAPSADIFQAILKAYKIDVSKFLAGIDTQYIDRQLRQIPEVANYIQSIQQQKTHSIKKWLFSSAIACVIGLTLIVAGYKSLIFPNEMFEYKSPGILLADEPTDYFDIWHQSELKGDAWLAKKCEMLQRANTDIIFSDQYRGNQFNIPVSGGSRTYYHRGNHITNHPANRYLLLIGTIISFSGLFGFWVEYRLRKIS